jgi:general secretion pathway protein D
VSLTSLIRAVAVSLALLLAGCAGQEAFKRGEAQFMDRQWDAAAESYRQANLADPTNLQYRVALTRANQYRLQALLDEANTARQQNPASARETYRKVLALDSRNERAEAGLRAIEQQEKLARLYTEASRAQQQGRDIEARQKLKRLLDEAPDHAQARALVQRMDEKVGRSSGTATLDPAYQKPVTLEFREAPLRAVFDALSQATGINVIFDRDLRQDSKVTIFLRQVPLNDALEQITTANGLARRVVNPNTLLIYPAQPQKAREYQDLTVRSFFLANADGKQIGNMLKTVLKVKDFHLDEKRNLIVIRDTPEVVAMAAKLIDAHDQPEPEVMLEVEILEVKHTTLNELGIKFPDQVVFGVPSPIALNALRGTTASVTGLDKALILNLKRQVGETNLLANPRIRVRNKEKAKIHIGDRVPVITSNVSSVAALTTESVSYLDVGIKLEVEPSIQMEHVVIKTGLEVSSVVNTITTKAGSTVYQVGTRNASTTLTLRDGETQVLAGLLQRNERENSSRLPGLGDIPVLGRLFSSQSTDGDKTEILLSITPHILSNMERPSDELAEFNAGPEAGRQGSAAGPATVPAVQPAPPPVPAPTGIGGIAPAAAAPQPQSGVSSFVATPVATVGATGASIGSTPTGASGTPVVSPSVPTPAPPAVPAAATPSATPPASTPAASTPAVIPEFELPPGMGRPAGSQ